MRTRLLPSAVVLAVLFTACSEPGTANELPPTTTIGATSVTTSPPSSAAPDSVAPGTSTTITTLAEPAEFLLYDHWQGSFMFGPGIRIDVHAPEVRSNHPIAVTVHGGGWYGGGVDAMGQLADGLAARGFVVFNATYRTINQGGSFPSMVEDVACAVAYAREHALDYSTTDDHFTLIGHSAGAHLSALVALAPSVFGTSCQGADVPVDAWVGLAGPYDTDLYAFLLQPFFGTAFAEDPEPWRAGNPLTYIGSIDPSLGLLLIHGDVDELVPATMSENLYLAAEQAGANVSLRIIPNAGHGEVNSPRIVGDLIADFVAADRSGQ